MFDAIHATFGVLYTLITFLNILALNRDKKVRGISIHYMGFVCLFSTWNIFYLFNLEQYVAASSAVTYLTVNLIWITQMLYYLRLESRS